MDDDDGVYTIAVAARLTGMHPQTLRKYERAGLLMPSRQAGNQRLYSAADVRRLRRIQHLVERGLNIAGLELALAMSDRLDAVGPDATHAELRTAIDEVAGMSRRPVPGEGPAGKGRRRPRDEAGRPRTTLGSRSAGRPGGGRPEAGLPPVRFEDPIEEAARRDVAAAEEQAPEA